MLGFWEFILISAIISFVVFPYLAKRSRQIKQKKPDPRIIELDEENYEIHDD